MMPFEKYDNKHFNEGITLGGRHSFRDLNLYIKSRKIEAPKKNISRVSVPFSNGFYDFSTISGEATYSERKIEYEIDIIAESPEELELRRSIFLNWAMTVNDSRIDDDALSNYHFIGSFDSVNFSDDETGEKTTATLSFVCQPFKVENNPTIVDVSWGSGEIANSGMPVLPYIETPTGTVLSVNYSAESYVVPAQGPGEPPFRLPVPLITGENVVTAASPGEGVKANVKVIFYREVL